MQYNFVYYYILCPKFKFNPCLSLGRVNGVAKQLKDSFPKLLAVACSAHKLALACKDASNDVRYMATFRDHLQDLYLFFHNSANRTATLKAASISLGLSDLKVKVIAI